MKRFIVFAAFAAAAGAGIPAYADGQPCSLVSVWDPTGTDSRDIGIRTVQAGPWQVAGATDVVITCSVQFDSADPAAPDVARVSSAPAETAVLAPTPVRYVKAPGTVVYLCTDVTWTGGSDAGGCVETVEIAHGCQSTGPGPARRCHPTPLNDPDRRAARLRA